MPISGLEWEQPTFCEEVSQMGREVTNIVSHKLRIELSEPVIRDGKQLYQHTICVTESWVKGGRRFEIRHDHFAEIEQNFYNRKNGAVVVDYEHASEQPEVARGGPVVAAGWIHGLAANGHLTAEIEWTPQASQMIKSAQYRYFSPAIDFDGLDKATGERQGATLTSGALTNHPFLEELPAITLSDREACETSLSFSSKSPLEVSKMFDPNEQLPDAAKVDQELAGKIKRLMKEEDLTYRLAYK